MKFFDLQTYETLNWKKHVDHHQNKPSGQIPTHSKKYLTFKRTTLEYW
jgi:hypothetical protein